MRIKTLGAVVCLATVFCTGCYFRGSGSSGTGGSHSGGSFTFGDDNGDQPPPAECMPPTAAFSAMRRLHDDNESKVHELIKCGGMQTSMSRNFLIVVIASNRDLFDQQAYNDLVEFARGYGVELQVQFNREAAGLWTMPIAVGTTSSFNLQFHDTTTGNVIEPDPFVIDSYLTGVTATSSLSIDLMKADLFARNTITFAWKELGPLAHELNHGKPIPNPFTISVSFADLARFVWGIDIASGTPDLGPLDSVQDLKVDSEVLLTDSIGNTNVEYDVAGLVGTLRSVSANGVSFDVKHINSTNGEYRLEGSATGLRYAAGPRTLLGRFDYRITGPEGALLVSDDYDPSAGLSVKWSCP